MKFQKRIADTRTGAEIVLLFSILLVLILLSLPAAFAYSGNGAGTIEDPYRISNTEELNEMRNDLSAHYILVTDLDLSETDALWEPVGDIYHPFCGTLNGNQKRILNLTVRLSDAGQSAGLFGETSETAEIFDLTLENAVVENGFHAGSLIGYNNGNIKNCRILNTTVYSTGSSGGLTGTHNTGQIEYCTAEGRVSGDEAGGLAGKNNNGTVWASSANVWVTGNRSAGGFVGRNYYGEISNCMSAGSVIGNTLAGGFAGSNHLGTIEFCYTTCSVEAKRETGGFVGVNQGLIKDCVSMNEYINNRPFFSMEESPYPPYRRYIFGAGEPVGRITSANYYAGEENYTAAVSNCASWEETKTNRRQFGAVNGKIVQTKDLRNTFPDSVWTGWDQTIWENGCDGLPEIINKS